jgi:hypothetical protein
MKVVVDLEYGPVIQKLEEYTRKAVQFFYGWITTDGEILGYILGVIHFTIACALVIAIIMSYTVYPVFWLQCILFAILFIIWLQHIFFKACFSIVAERNLTKSVSPFYNLSKDLIGISSDDLITYFMIAETMGVLCLGIGIVGRCSERIYEIYGIKL